MSTQRLGQLLVMLQFLLLALLVWNSAILDALMQWHIAVWLVFAASGIVGLSALWANRPGNFNIHPHPHPDGEFVRHGPYRWVRHPMYSAVLLFGLACLLADPSLQALLYLISLTLVLFGKVLIEERLMAIKHDGYTSYTQATKRLIPWIF